MVIAHYNGCSCYRFRIDASSLTEVLLLWLRVKKLFVELFATKCLSKLAEAGLQYALDLGTT